MKRRRIKIENGEAIYHCMSRIVGNYVQWDDQAKEIMRRQLWRTADFSGVEVLTYCIMSNHFHVLIRVPDRKKVVISDEELLRRYRRLYLFPSPYEKARLQAAETILKENGFRAEALRKRLLARMHDVSAFMKSFKQRFATWYNRTHERHGTHWSERFTSVLVESTPLAVRTVAAYIDLNPVRAGLVIDPKDYRWCGYAEAVAGNKAAQRGIITAVGHPLSNLYSPREQWDTLSPSRQRSAIREGLAEYRKLLFGTGAGAARGKSNAATIPEELATQTLQDDGELPTHALLRCRARYLTRGLILGSQSYVQAQINTLHQKGLFRRKPKARPLPSQAWQGLAAAKGFHHTSSPKDSPKPESASKALS